jgi:hypothetical protein
METIELFDFRVSACIDHGSTKVSCSLSDAVSGDLVLSSLLDSHLDDVMLFSSRSLRETSLEIALESISSDQFRGLAKYSNFERDEIVVRDERDREIALIRWIQNSSA